MGCGCCVTTFKDEVEDEVFAYIKRLKKHDRTKNILIHEIQNDLIKRAETIEKYKYPYRHDDVEKTVKIYKNYIYKKFKGNVELLEDKIKTKGNEENKKVIKKDDDKLLLKDKNENNKDKISEDKEKKPIINKIVDNNENKGSMVNNKNEEKLESILKSDLNPILDDKIKNYSEKDESKEQKEKSIDNIQQFLPKSEEKEINNKIDNDDKEKEIKSLKSEQSKKSSKEIERFKESGIREKIRIE